jgi:hypothetical protein
VGLPAAPRPQGLAPRPWGCPPRPGPWVLRRVPACVKCRWTSPVPLRLSRAPFCTIYPFFSPPPLVPPCAGLRTGRPSWTASSAWPTQVGAPPRGGGGGVIPAPTSQLLSNNGQGGVGRAKSKTLFTHQPAAPPPPLPPKRRLDPHPPASADRARSEALRQALAGHYYSDCTFQPRINAASRRLAKVRGAPSGAGGAAGRKPAQVAHALPRRLSHPPPLTPPLPSPARSCSPLPCKSCTRTARAPRSAPWWRQQWRRSAGRSARLCPTPRRRRRRAPSARRGGSSRRAARRRGAAWAARWVAGAGLGKGPAREGGGAGSWEGCFEGGRPNLF